MRKDERKKRYETNSSSDFYGFITTSVLPYIRRMVRQCWYH